MRYKITIDHNKCIGCEKCIKICKNFVFRKVNDKVHILNEKNCDLFGECIKQCPANALRIQPKVKEVCIGDDCFTNESELYNWPVQLMNISCDNKYLLDSDLLICATCSAYAYGNFHQDFIKDHVVLIVCLKNTIKEMVIEKCKRLFETVDFNSVEVVTMNSSCCLDLLEVVCEGMKRSGKKYHMHERIIQPDGEVIE